MADGDRDAGLAQAADIGGIGDVAALHRVAEIVQHLGDAGHADAADADEMDGADGQRQALSCAHLLAHRACFDEIGQARRGIGTRAMLRAARGGVVEHRPASASKAPSRLAQCVGVKSRCGDHRGAAGLGQRARIGRLMVVDRARQRHQDRRPAGDREFGDGGGAGARDHQMRGRKRSATSGKNGGSSALMPAAA